MPPRHDLRDVLNQGREPVLDAKAIALPDVELVPRIRAIVDQCQLHECIDLEEIIRNCVYGYWSTLENNDDYECMVYEFVDQWMANWSMASEPRVFEETQIESKAKALVQHLVDLKPYVWRALGLISSELMHERISFMGVNRVVGNYIVLQFEYDT